jgi:hypothetical protein
MVYNLVNEHPHATDFGVHPGVDTWLLAHSHNRTGMMILHDGAHVVAKSMVFL